MQYDFDDFAGCEPELVHSIRQMVIDNAESETSDRRMLTPEGIDELKQWAERLRIKHG
jgi:hypothetical protein